MSRFKITGILLFVLVAILNLLTAALLVFSLQTDIRGVESNVIYTIQQALTTGRIYTDPEQLPYAITQYSPLFYTICIKLSGFFGFEPGDEVYKIYIVSRFVSVLAAVGVSVLAYIIASRYLHLNRKTALIIALTAFVIPVPWFFLARPDALTSFFLFASIAAFLSYIAFSKKGKQGQFLWLSVSALMAVLALFSKQNGFICMAAPGLFLLLNRRLKDLAVYSFSCLVFLVLGYLFWLKGYDPEILKANLIKGVDNGIDLLAFFKKVVFVYLSEFALLVALMAALLALGLRQRELIRQAPQQVKFIGLFFLVVTAFAFVSALKAGSAHNYLIDSLILSLFLIGYAMQYVEPLKQAVLNPVVRLFGMIAFTIFVLNFSLQNFYTYAGEGALKTWYNRKKGYDTEVELAGMLEKELQQNPGTYFLSLNRNINNHLFEYVIFPQSEIADKPHQWKVYDYRNFEADLKAGKIKFVLLPDGKKPETFAGKKLHGFKLYKDNVSGFDLFRWEGEKLKPDTKSLP